jgi:hypothetical protein
MKYPITSRFLERENFRQHGHSGIDFYMDEGTPLRSIRDGVVDKIVNYGSKVNAGKCIKIRWEDGRTAIYGHLSKFGDIKEGQTVHAGDVIGFSGHSGHVVGATGNHLHFGLKSGDGHFLDPSPYIKDIQHMNDANYFVSNHITKITEHAPEVTQLKINFFDYMHQHTNAINDTLSSLKVHLISPLTNDVFIIKILEQLFQFVSGHASFLNLIIAHIF